MSDWHEQNQKFLVKIGKITPEVKQEKKETKLTKKDEE